jgi:hypothetical protein
MVEHKDLILGVLGASSAFAGLLLVFSGLTFTQAASFPSETDNVIINRVRSAARFAIYPFWGFLIVTLLSVSWMLHQSQCLYATCLILFIILVLGTGVYGTIVSFHYL